jgi:hypothetical protein
MAPGIYKVSFTSGYTGEQITRIVKVGENRLHYVQSETTGQWRTTVPFGNEKMGYKWEPIE